MNMTTKRRKAISKTLRVVFVEMADSAAHSRLNPGKTANEVDFSRSRYVILEGTISNCLQVACGYTPQQAEVYVRDLVAQRISWQAHYKIGNPQLDTYRRAMELLSGKRAFDLTAFIDPSTFGVPDAVKTT